jgi:glycosyltransferase involved in cell wall biosynthesis
MHIALVNQWYPPDYGGVATYNQAMAQAYAELDHQVTVITSGAGEHGPAFSVEAGIHVHRLSRWTEPYGTRRIPVVGPHVRSVRHAVYSYRASRVLARLHQASGIDVAEFAEVNAESFFTVPRLRRKLPIVVRCHTPHFLLRRTTPQHDGFDMRTMEPLESVCIRCAAALTAPSQDLASRVERAMRLPAGRITVIPNAIDTRTFVPRSRRVEGSSPVLSILHVGRLAREKGVFVLAEALARLAASSAGSSPRETPPWKVIFAGSDRSEGGISNESQMRKVFAGSGIGDRITFLGSVDGAELVRLYQAADICVVPSILYESFSYTCVQAMACGCPVIATTMGGIPEVVLEGKTGVLVPPGNAPALTTALQTLLRDADLRRHLGEAGRARVVQNYAPHDVARRNLALYAAVME